MTCEGLPGPNVLCVDDVAYVCDGASDMPTSATDCKTSDEHCAPGLGCRVCTPGTGRCDGETPELCRSDGSAYDRGSACDTSAGLRCSVDGCVDLCARAAETHSYLGCEYWPTTLRNGVISGTFEFAVVVANPQLVPAEVVVDGPVLPSIEVTVAPGGLEVITLPWNDALRGDGTSPPASVLSVAGGYRLRSDVPVAVTQFNPLTFQLPTHCVERDCFSYSNDASLLLPTHVLTGSYLAMSRASHVLRVDGVEGGAPGLLAIVGTSETPTSVEVRVTAPTLAGASGTDPAPVVPGTPATFVLGRGDVLQLLSEVPVGCAAARTETDGSTVLEYCDPGADFDLTGTEIRADAPVAVFSGHECTFVPFDRWACDHLEEQLFPVESLGVDLFVPGTHAIRPGEPNLLRLVSAADDNVVRFEPPLDGVPATTTLDRGEWLEVEIFAPVWARGSGPMLGAVFLVGQDYRGLRTAGTMAVGDPAMALVVPSEQFRDRYTILAPDTYVESWVDVAIPVGGYVTVDGSVLRTMPIDATSMSVAHVRIRSGVHELVGTAPFGLYVSGLAPYTSYYAPGGMDFEPITPPF